MNQAFSHLHQLMCQMRYELLNEKKWEWAEWVDRSIDLMEQRDARTFEHFLAAFGALGEIEKEVVTWSERCNEDETTCVEKSGMLALLLIEAQTIASQLRETGIDISKMHFTHSRIRIAASRI